MGIKGWSDVVRFPRLGEIRLGEKDERGVPKALDYFVVPPEVQEVYGEQPRELDIMFPHEDSDVVMPAALKRYGEQWGLICRGDGEWATLSLLYAKKSPGEYCLQQSGDRFVSGDGEVLPVIPGEDGRGWVQIRCPYKACPHYQAQRCREVVLVNVLLPRVPGVLGVYTIATGSFHSYTNIRNALGMLREMVGRNSFVPLKLRVRMQEVHPEVGDKRIRRQVPVMYIDMAGMNLERMIELARERRLALVHRLPEQLVRERVELEPGDEDRAPELLYPHLAQSARVQEAGGGGSEGVTGEQAPGLPPAPGGAEGAGARAVVDGDGAQRRAAAGGVRAARQVTDGEKDKIRRQAEQLAPEGRRGVLALVQDPFTVPETVAAEQIVSMWDGGSVEFRARVERALAVELVVQSVGEAALAAELERRGVRRTEAGETLDMLLYDSALAVEDLREVVRAVRGNGSNGGRQLPASDGRGGAPGRGMQPAGNPASGRPKAAGGEGGGAVVVTLQATGKPYAQEQGGRRFVLCPALVRAGAGGVPAQRTLNLAAEGAAGEALARVQPGQLFQARVLPVSATAGMVQEVLDHAAVAG